MSYLERFPRLEKFGLGIGIREGDSNVILAYLWPKQEAQDATFCRMRIEDLGLIVPCLVDLREELQVDVPIGVSAWVHTHPHIGLFLSGTDRSTFANWAEVDPRMLAVVVDVFATPGPKCKAFAPDFAETVVGDWNPQHDGKFQGFLERLVGELPTRMEQKGRPVEALVTPQGVWADGGFTTAC